MQKFLQEAIGLSKVMTIKGFRVRGTKSSTQISAVDEGKDLFVLVKSKSAYPEFEGDFGIPNLKLLESLLSFDAFNDGALNIVRTKRRIREDDGSEREVELPQNIDFVAKKKGSATFWFSHGAGLPKGIEDARIPWNIKVTPTKEAVADFTKLATIFSTPDCKYFGMATVDGDLMFTFGTNSSTTHHGEMVFQEQVSGTLDPRAKLSWDSAKFRELLKSMAKKDITLKISDRGLLCISFETEFAEYDFYLRCTSESEAAKAA